MTTIGKVDYNFDVRPILADKCFKCHGPDGNQREASLRFDTPDGPFLELEESPGKFAVVPGELENSQMYYKIYHTDSDEMMPPPESNLHLTDYEKNVLKAWILQGAEYKPHWAFNPPEKRDPPELDQSIWPQNEIDHFVFEKMREADLLPNEEADRERLLKRVSYDLTGLPPSVELQVRFLEDQSEDAYEKIVDELLQSPHYGEKMAVHWLDVARYADSHGYQDDGLRTMWPWRDWVIHAFNENYPFDKFLTWQLAGDLLDEPDWFGSRIFLLNYKL